MRGPLPAPEGRDRGSDAEQHGTSRAGGRASAEGAASRRVASDFGAVGAGRAFTDRRQQVGAAGGRSLTAAFVGSEPSSRRRVRVARLCTRVVRGSPSGSGVTGQLLGWARPFSPPLSGPEVPPHRLAARVRREATRGPAAPTCLASRPHALCFSRTVLEATCSECARARGCDTASRRCPS